MKDLSFYAQTLAMTLRRETRALIIDSMSTHLENLKRTQKQLRREILKIEDMILIRDVDLDNQRERKLDLKYKKSRLLLKLTTNDLVE